MNGEELQGQIYSWLEQHYPEGPRWMDPEFDALGETAIEIKMISAFDAIEANLANGGWAQVLWNCFGSWRKLIGIAEEGYALIGAQEQVVALGQLRDLCERNADECAQAMALEDGSMERFAEFTSRSYGETGNNWERLFFDDSGLYELRLAWLENNQERVLRALG